MNFKRYQHIERIDRHMCKGIHEGECYIFPKIDGTCVSVYLNDDGEITTGGRNGEITDKDSKQLKAFRMEMTESPYTEKIKEYFAEHPNHILFGEWLIKNHFVGYKDSAWNKFYVFDVYDRESGTYLEFPKYSQYLDDSRNIRYIPPIDKITPESSDALLKFCKNIKSEYLCKDGEFGEGVVVKNYDFSGTDGKQQFAKYVQHDFTTNAKKTRRKRYGREGEIVELYITRHFVKKEFGKFCVNTDQDPSGTIDIKYLSAIIKQVIREFVKEEMDGIMTGKYKNIILDVQVMNKLASDKVKEILSEHFVELSTKKTPPSGDDVQ